MPLTEFPERSLGKYDHNANLQRLITSYEILF
jgi:hypothetical protein